MLKKFSFLYHYLEEILCVLDKFAPGIIRSDIIYFDVENKILKARTKNNSIDTPEGIALNIEGFDSEINEFRNKNRGFYWFTKSEIPWLVPDFENKKTDLLSKFDVLMIAVENDETKPLNDLIFFYFPKNLSNLLMHAGTSDITSRELDFVGKTYESSVNALITLANSNLSIWKTIKERIENINQQIENKNNELENII